MRGLRQLSNLPRNHTKGAFGVHQGKMGLPEEALEGFTQYVADRSPLHRLGQVEEIAAAAVFLASDDSSYMTAAVYACRLY